ncbi:FAD/NAD(P)-binding protein [Pelagicoccus mobilis]|uniref:FAD/NAD(P)-binding protein n=1 Tax=Pelagicoccus mobilis TaxID=415221 RepID=A0A934RTN9_9BACT|nr:FAD/NAD(P)-binding protein [Pelagicoccus mobilis]MBK1876238.1 FAD/NAD(P)-binding protein [Pelagicoccus mobilis]
MIAPTQAPMVTTPWTITRIEKETEDTFTLDLKASEVEASPYRFEPGQFNMLYVFGVGEAPISISGDPAKPKRLRHTTRIVGTVTRAMGALRKGESIGIRGPYGSSWPLEQAKGKDVIIVSGGIGLAPLRPALHKLLAHRQQYRRIILLYGARTPEDILYNKHLEKWRARFDVEVYITVDRATRNWRGNVGVVTPLVKRAPFHRDNAIAMICGPEIMMRYAVQELRTRGLQAEDIYVSIERNMKCAIGHCGHCQYGPAFTCKDGPVFRYDKIEHLFNLVEI